MAEINYFYSKERILKFCEYQMYEEATFDLINFDNRRGFLTGYTAVTLVGSDLAKYINKSSSWILWNGKLILPAYNSI